MRYFIPLICFLVTLPGYVRGQHVDDDSVSYTPIPLPVPESITKKKFLSDSIFTNRKPVYFFSLNVGSLFGCNNCIDAAGVSTTFSAANGVAFKKLRVGVAGGFDSYLGWNAIPVSAVVSWDLWGNRNRNAFFIQLNYGHSKAWMINALHPYGFDKAKGGRMFSPQVGYRIKYHDINISLLTGIKLQRVFAYYKYPTWNWNGFEYIQGTNFSKVEENISRFMVSVSVGWK
jgi:hypothetical protein